MVSLIIRPFTEADISAALDLCRSAGWNQLHDDWMRLIAHQPDGCFVAEIDRRLVGTVTTTSYRSDLAWIGMMLVHPEFRRRGVATELINASLGFLRHSGVRCVKLDATPAGQPVYEKLGFRPEWSYHRWSRDASSNDKANDSANDFAEVEMLSEAHFELDGIAFGADRSCWLKRLARASRSCLRDRGFGMVRSGHLANYLGPIVAESRSVASEVVAELLVRLRGTTYWDVPDLNRDAVQLAKSLGFQPIRDLTRMWTGSELIDPKLELQYALSDPGTG